MTHERGGGEITCGLYDRSGCKITRLLYDMKSGEITWRFYDRSGSDITWKIYDRIGGEITLRFYEQTNLLHYIIINKWKYALIPYFPLYDFRIEIKALVAIISLTLLEFSKDVKFQLSYFFQ